MVRLLAEAVAICEAFDVPAELALGTERILDLVREDDDAWLGEALNGAPPPHIYLTT